MNRRINQSAIEKCDARKLKPEVQHERRIQVIELHMCGISRAQIVVDTGMSNTAVARIIKLYEAGGVEALVPQVRGRRVSDQRSVPAEQERALQNIRFVRR